MRAVARRVAEDHGFRAVPAFFGLLWRFAGWRTLRAILLAALGALLEGGLLVMLVPLLSVAGLTGPIGPHGVTQRILAMFGIRHGTGTLGATALIACWIAGAVAVTVFGAFRDLEGQATQEQFAEMLRRRFQAAAMGADWMRLQRERAADIIGAINNGIMRAGEGATALIQSAGRLLGVAVQLGIAIAVAPRPCAIAALVGVAVLPFQWRRLRWTFRRGREAARGGRNLQAIVSEHVGAIKLAKAHGAEAGLTAHFRAALDQVRMARLAMVRQRVLSRMGFRITALLGLTAVVWISVTQFGTKGPALLVLVAVFARLVPGFSDILLNAHVLAEAVSAWADTERQFLQLDAAREAAADGPPPSGAVTFEAVEMTWPGRGEAVLRGISLTLAARRTTALVGPSGAGKTTLADLALGLLTPTGGRICVGGTALRGPARAAWRQAVAYVPQGDLLFNDTIRANLLWARPDAEEADLWAALRLAALEDVVNRLPKRLDSTLGDRGIFLSGGERQRLALARALLRQPAFLVLDEATSHLDGKNERLIQEALDGLQHRVTMLVIAHRLETVRRADHIIVVEAGRILEQGSWDTLVARPGGWLHAAASQDRRAPAEAVTGL